MTREKSQTLTARYMRWSIEQKAKHGYTCQICGIKNEKNKSENPFEKIVCHHVLPVQKYGVENGLLMDERNIIVVCEYCHQLVCHRRSITMMSFSNYFQGTASNRNKMIEKQNAKIMKTVDFIINKFKG